MRVFIPIVMIMAAWVMTGCSSGDAEQRYTDALSELAEAQSERDEARQALLDQQQALTEAQQALVAARGELENAQTEVQNAQAEARKRATDSAIFDVLQSHYVDDDAFDGSRIAVLVNGGAVTLRGQARSSEVSQQAEAFAKQAAGVLQVINQLTIKAPVQDADS